MRRAIIIAAAMVIPGAGFALLGLVLYRRMRERQGRQLARLEMHRQVAEELSRMRARVPEDQHWGQA